LAIPAKRRQRRTDITYLSDVEVTALLGAPDQTTRAGRRDHAMFQTAITTGLRMAELTALKVSDVHLGRGPHLLCHGKRRKDLTTPLDRQTVNVLRVFAAKPSTGD